MSAILVVPPLRYPSYTQLIAAMRAATAGARRLLDGVRDQRLSREYDRELRAQQVRVGGSASGIAGTCRAALRHQ